MNGDLRAAIALAIVGCSSPGPGAAARARPAVADTVRIDSELVARRVAPDAYVITHEPFHSSNVLVVRMADSSLVIASSPFETEGTRAMLRWLRATFRPTRMIAINTHFHFDGTGGNRAYAEAGVEVVASTQTATLLASRGDSLRAAVADGFDDPARRARIERLEIVPPTRTFDASRGEMLAIGGEEVRIVYPGPAHSPDNVVVHFPARGLLFGGCMIKASGASIGYTGDADLAHWERAVRALEPLAPRVVVPGHGAPGGPELLAGTIEIVRAARPVGGKEQ
jgi:glyoxylase-like metal-dependent hydrolase (beta-lactamase superfamily II)